MSVLDSEVSLCEYRARYYDQSAGRFLREDPIGFTGGDDFYLYAKNNPVLLNDPTGLLPGGNGRSCDPKTCAISVSCLPTHGTAFSHCTVTTQDGSVYTAYDGEPSGSIWWSTLVVTKGPGSPPGPNTFFRKTIDCKDIGCAQRAADSINKRKYTYDFLFGTNSNNAAAGIAHACGAYPNFPWSAWGAY